MREFVGVEDGLVNAVGPNRVHYHDKYGWYRGGINYDLLCGVTAFLPKSVGA